MTSEQVVLDEIRHIFVEELDLNLTYEQLADETVPLFEEGLALDSVVLAELITFVERRFDIVFDDDLLRTESFRNLQSVARVITNQLAHKQN